jgi:hypothetical protein
VAPLVTFLLASFLVLCAIATAAVLSAVVLSARVSRQEEARAAQTVPGAWPVPTTEVPAEWRES